MINLTAKQVVENLEAALEFVKQIPIKITNESGEQAVLVDSEIYFKYLAAQRKLTALQEAANASEDPKPDVEDLPTT